MCRPLYMPASFVSITSSKSKASVTPCPALTFYVHFGRLTTLESCRKEIPWSTHDGMSLVFAIRDFEYISNLKVSSKCERYYDPYLWASKSWKTQFIIAHPSGFVRHHTRQRVMPMTAGITVWTHPQRVHWWSPWYMIRRFHETLNPEGIYKGATLPLWVGRSTQPFE